MIDELVAADDIDHGDRGVKPVAGDATAVSVRVRIICALLSKRSGSESRAPMLGDLFSSHMNTSTSIARAADADPGLGELSCLT